MKYSYLDGSLCALVFLYVIIISLLPKRNHKGNCRTQILNLNDILWVKKVAFLVHLHLRSQLR